MTLESFINIHKANLQLYSERLHDMRMMQELSVVLIFTVLGRTSNKTPRQLMSLCSL